MAKNEGWVGNRNWQLGWVITTFDTARFPQSPCVVCFITEPFLESVPQVHIILMFIANINIACTPSGPNYRKYGGDGFIAFSTSILSAAFGISKFIKSGPCHILKSDSFLMGFATLSYILVLGNIIATFLSKAFLIIFYLSYKYDDGNIDLQRIAILSLNYIPQLVHVSLHCMLMPSIFVNMLS